MIKIRKIIFCLQEFGIDIVRSLITRMNLWEDSGTHLERLLKISMINFMCRLQDESCLNNATDKFEKINSDYFLNPNEIQNK